MKRTYLLPLQLLFEMIDLTVKSAEAIDLVLVFPADLDFFSLLLL